MKFYWIVLLICTVAEIQTVFGQDCLSVLRQAYKSSLEKMENRRGGMLHLQFSTKTVMSEAFGGGSREVSVSLLSSDQLSVLKSDELNVFQDTATTINVIPDKKLVYILNGTHNRSGNLAANQIAFIHDSLFQSSEVLNCKNYRGDGTAKQAISIALHDKNMRRYNIKKIDYLLENDELKKVTMWFTPESPVKMTEITYGMVDFSSPQTLHEDALSYVFDAGHRLRNEFKNYKVIDTRKAR
jgi:hypothetical protein